MTKKIATLDLETDPFLFGRYPQPFAADVFDGDEHFTFWGADCVEQVMLFLADKAFIVYAHNGGKFDYHFMLDYLPNKTDVKIIAGRLAQFVIGECEFRDSMNILPIGLAKFSKMDIDYALFEADKREENKALIIEYLHYDTEALHDLVSSFVDEYGLQLTQAGAAMAYWKTNYLPPEKKKEWLQPTSDSYYSEFSQFYYGGRVECFQTGIINKPFDGYDIHSAYPFAMLSDHPIGSAHFELSPSINELPDLCRASPHGFYDVMAIARRSLPFRDENKLIFPCDNNPRRYRVTGWELLAALDTNSVDLIKCNRAVIHSEVINFRGYVEHFYNMRLDAKKNKDKKSDIFAKIFMNALYGKFAANPENYGSYTVGDIEALFELQEIGYLFSGTLGPNILMRRDLYESEIRYYNVATAASITGFVRAYLWRNLANCKNPIYCDTDCIFAEELSVKVGDRLGDWGHEGSFSFGAVAGKKLYAMKVAGEPKKYKKASKGARLTPWQIIRVALGKEFTYKQQSPTYSVHGLPTFTERKIRLTGHAN